MQEGAETACPAISVVRRNGKSILSDTLASPLTLYVDARLLSPYAMAAYVALTEKGLPVELRLVDLEAGEQRLRPYASRAPTCRVPALTHDTFHLTESSAIIEYLEDVFPAPTYPSLYPADARQRARARQVQAWLGSDLGALRRIRATEIVFHNAPPPPARRGRSSRRGQADTGRQHAPAGRPATAI